MADNNEGRQKKTQHRHPRHLPPRPKRPLTAYTAFLKEYFKAHRPRNACECREGMRTASGIWNKMSDKEKRAYCQAGAKERAKYERDMAKWRVQKKLLKQPASSYALFLKATWEAERESGRNITDMNEHVSQLWRGMSEGAKGVYLKQHKDLAQKYYDTMELLDSKKMDINSISVPTARSLTRWRGPRERGQLNESDEEDEEDEEEESEEEAEEDEDAEADEDVKEDAEEDAVVDEEMAKVVDADAEVDEEMVKVVEADAEEDEEMAKDADAAEGEEEMAEDADADVVAEDDVEMPKDADAVAPGDADDGEEGMEE